MKKRESALTHTSLKKYEYIGTYANTRRPFAVKFFFFFLYYEIVRTPPLCLLCARIHTMVGTYTILFSAAVQTA